MSGDAVRARPFDPAAAPGLREQDFSRVCINGFGDGHNSYPHSAAWFGKHLYIGTTRSNFQMLKAQGTFNKLPLYRWPVEGPDDPAGLYRELDRRAQIWRFDSPRGVWEEVFRAPMVAGAEDEPVARETGLRAMVVFQSVSDSAPALYTATWAVSRAPGALLLRSEDGINFEPITPYGIIDGLPITATRVLAVFKDKLYTSPTAVRGHARKFVANVSGYPVLFASTDPREGWIEATEPGFGDSRNLGVFALAEFNDQLYAGTFNNSGFELWRSRCEGKAPYKWFKVLEKGAYRGAENQTVMCMTAFRDALYIGTGIQNGGHDVTNRIGPAAFEILRVHPDDSWDLIVGTSRETPFGKKVPLSCLQEGFGNPLNGYAWSIAVHDGWLYLGSMDSFVWCQYLKPEYYPSNVQKMMSRVGLDNFLSIHCGCDLWRSADGENWLPVTSVGFDTGYNLGFRNLVSTPHGLFAAIANPFGPRVATGEDGEWKYRDNPRGGLEVWQGTRDHAAVTPLEKIEYRSPWIQTAD
ncbi:MAG: hypothetical protein OEQ18_07515 [Gammaproteobacteria bacterium]|nr:hypothetical protein [Gammaproteobacteria bacterium]